MVDVEGFVGGLQEGGTVFFGNVVADGVGLESLEHGGSASRNKSLSGDLLVWWVDETRAEEQEGIVCDVEARMVLAVK